MAAAAALGGSPRGSAASWRPGEGGGGSSLQARGPAPNGNDSAAAFGGPSPRSAPACVGRPRGPRRRSSGEPRTTTANGRSPLAAPPPHGAGTNRKATNGSEAQCASRPPESEALEGAASGRVIDSSVGQWRGAIVRRSAPCDLSRLRTGVAGRDGDISPSLGQWGGGERLYKGGRGQAERRHFVVATEGVLLCARGESSASAAKRGADSYPERSSPPPPGPNRQPSTRILLPASVALLAAPALLTLQREPAGPGGARLP